MGNLVYFLEEIIPVAAEADILMAIHPDDPPWSVFGLPRVVTGEKNILHLLSATRPSGKRTYFLYRVIGG